MLVEKTDIGFCVDRYKTFDELPLATLDVLPFCVYVIDYHWTYLFINKLAAKVFGGKIRAPFPLRSGSEIVTHVLESSNADY